MRVLVVKNGSTGGGKEVRIDISQGIQHLLKSAGEALSMPFACLLYTPQGGLVDGTLLIRP